MKTVALVVAEGPPHHEVSAAHRSEDLGATFRDLTYEVRRHHRLPQHTAGVIVSRVERGTRASVEGLGRFDIVLQVNERPVPTSRRANGRSRRRGICGSP